MRYQKEISKQAGFSKFLKGLERKPEGTRDDGIGFLPVLVPLLVAASVPAMMIWG